MRKFHQIWHAGGFNQIIGRGPSSFTGINVSSASTFADLTVNSITGAAGWRGIATMNSGTTIASVAATAARSGAVIMTQIMQYTGDRTAPGTWGQIPLLAVQSVRAGAFEIVAVASYAPLANMPIAWMVIR